MSRWPQCCVIIETDDMTVHGVIDERVVGDGPERDDEKQQKSGKARRQEQQRERRVPPVSLSQPIQAIPSFPDGVSRMNSRLLTAEAAILSSSRSPSYPRCVTTV